MNQPELCYLTAFVNHQRILVAVKVLTAFILFLLSVSQAWAIHVVEVKDRHTNADISSHVEYLLTDQQLRWPWEVAYLPGWRRASGDYPAFGLDNRSYWFRVGLHNRSGEMQLVMMDIRHSMLNVLDVFIVKNGQLLRVWNTGVARGSAAKPYPSKSFTLPLTLETDDGFDVYMRAQSNSFLQFPVELQDIRIYTNQQAVGKLQMGVVSGAFILAGLYALLMYAFIRERRFTYYALFCLSLVATFWLLKGYAILYDIIPYWLDDFRLLLTTSNLLLMGLILSSLDMFRVWLPPRQRTLCRGILLLVAGVTLALWFIPLVWGIYCGLACYGLVTILAISFCFYFLRRGSWLQRLYCYSWLGFMLGCLSLFATR